MGASPAVLYSDKIQMKLMKGGCCLRKEDNIGFSGATVVC